MGDCGTPCLYYGRNDRRKNIFALLKFNHFPGESHERNQSQIIIK